MAERKRVININENPSTNLINEDQKRIDHILENLVKLAVGDFDIKEFENVRNDNLDAIDRGLVMLSEHLQESRELQQKDFQIKENLLKEVHHRVKNNLQIISSLLNLQASYSKNRDAAKLLRESQYRINSMSLIHEMLYKNTDVTGVNCKDYMDQLIKMLIQSFKASDQIVNLDISGPNMFIELDTAVTLGLMVNEIITNSLIHGLSSNIPGKLYLELKHEKEQCTLRIGDNGKGFDDQKLTDTLGLQLIETLTQQLDGKMERKINKGTHYSIKF